MATTRNEVFLASIAGVCTSFAFTGMNMAMTYAAIPVLLLPNPHAEKPSQDHLYLLRQWQNLYYIGSRGGPATVFLAAAAYVYAWSRLPTTATSYGRLLLFGAATALSVPAFTFAVMAPSANDELHRRADAAKGSKEDEAGPKSGSAVSSAEKTETLDLVRWWAQLNMMRGLLPAVGAAGVIYGMTL